MAANIMPSEINSVDVNQMIHYLQKKRKFQADQLGLPVSKHKCWDRRYIAETDPPYPEEKEFDAPPMEGKSDDGPREDGSEVESARDSNSFVEDTDSMLSLSGETKSDSENATSSPYDWRCTSSADGGDLLKKYIYSLNSRSQRKSGDDTPHLDSGLQTSMNIDDHLQEYGARIYSEYGKDTGEYSEKEIEDIINLNRANPEKEIDDIINLSRVNPDNFNQESPSGTKKLTIDKEFEQYFSMLML